MRSSLVVRASDCQCTSCNGPGFDPSIRRHSGIWGAADEAVLNIVRTERKKSPKKILKKKRWLKGTQDWESFWLRFWNLRYFFVCYVKILRFDNKNFLIGPLLGEVRFFRVVLGLRGMKKNFELGQKFFFFFFFNYGPKYGPILVFWKFHQLNAPGTTLCVDLG